MSTTDTIVRDVRDVRATEPIHEQRPPQPRRPRHVIGALVVAISAVAATVLAFWTAGTDRPSAPPAPVVDNPPAAYQPGGSVYEQQVPGTQELSAGHGPGSFRYDAPVPVPRRG